MYAVMDAGVIHAGDGSALALALVSLFIACLVVPYVVVVAWGMVRSFTEGDGEEDKGGS